MWILEIFYILGLLIIVSEVKTLFFPKKQLEIANSLNKKIEKVDLDKEQSSNLFNEKEKNMLFIETGYMIWIIIGLLFTPEWPLFLSIILLSFVPKDKLGPVWVIIDSILSIGIVILILANHYILNLFTNGLLY